MTKLFNQKLHPAIVAGKLARSKMLKHLSIPNREDYDREERYIKAVKKHHDYMERLTKVIIIVIRDYLRAVEKAKLMKELQGTELLHTICLTKLYCIMAGGGTYKAKSSTNPEFRIIPISSTHNDDVKLIVESFFDFRLRGNSIKGSSKWTPKETPKFGSELILSLLTIYEENRRQFDVILNFLKKHDDETIFEDTFIFELSETVSDELAIQLKQTIDC